MPTTNNLRPAVEISPDTLVYHDGAFRPYAQACYRVEERGVLFADGVYEVVRYDRGRAFRLDAHLRRMAAGMAAITMPAVDAAQLAGLCDELVRRSRLTDAKLYIQAVRGPAPRSFVIEAPQPPVLTLIATPRPPLREDDPLPAGRAIVVDDCRWTRCNVKSLMLLPASLARTQAQQCGAIEAIFERQKPGGTARHITEGAASNVFVIQSGRLRTHRADQWILPGVTRAVLFELAGRLGLPVDQTPFTRDELLAADEVFACSTTWFAALTHVDDQPIADATPGGWTRRLSAALRREMLEPSEHDA